MGLEQAYSPLDGGLVLDLFYLMGSNTRSDLDKLFFCHNSKQITELSNAKVIKIKLDFCVIIFIFNIGKIISRGGGESNTFPLRTSMLNCIMK